jgi:poly(3-hydroxybutyrate) depolymerase
MAFTTVSNVSETTTASTSHVVSMPAGDNTAKDLLVAIAYGAAAGAVTPPTGWSEIANSGSGAAGLSIYKNTTGESNATITFTSTNSARSAHNSWAITGGSGNIEVSSAATATSLSPDSANLTPSWGSKETLWLTGCYMGGKDVSLFSSYPTNYTTDGIISDTNGGVVGHCCCASSVRVATAASEDPGAFTFTGTNRVWHAFTVAIEPSSARTLAADAGSYTVTGTAASLEMGREVVAGTGSYAVTGTAASLEYGREAAADAGTYAVTGTAASLEYGFEVVAGAGSYALTGTAATLQINLPLTADAGSYAITGTDAALEYGREIAADAGSYAISGTAASLEVGREVVADAGSYAITGTDVALRKGITLAADAGSYAITGTDATFVHNRTLTAAAGSYTVTGTAAGLEYGFEVVAGDGSYAITGTDATVALGIGVSAAAGSYAISGTDAALEYGREVAGGAGSYSVTGTVAYGGINDTYLVTFTHGGNQRQFHVHIPPAFNPALGTYAAVIMYKGGGPGTPLEFEATTGMSAVADTNDFLAVYPSPWTAVDTTRQWNDYRSETDDGIDDVSFTEAMLALLTANWGVATNKYYAVGASAGGMFVYRLAKDIPTVFQAYGSAIAMLPEDQTVAATTPVRMCLIPSRHDPTMPWDGGAILSGGIDTVFSAPTTFAYWETATGATGRNSDQLVKTGAEDGTYVIKHSYSSHDVGGELLIYQVMHMGHDWAGASGSTNHLDASDIFADFFNIGPAAEPAVVAHAGVAGAETSQHVAATVTSHTVDLPWGGDGHLIAMMTTVTDDPVFPAGWTQQASVLNGSVRYVIYSRVVDGTEGNSITVTTASARRSEHNVYRLARAQTLGFSTATGSSTTPDPPSVSPAAGARNYLWLASYGSGRSDFVPTPVAPTDYLHIISGTSDAALGLRAASAWRNLNTATEDPGTFTGHSSAADWIAATISVEAESVTVAAGAGSYAVTGTAAALELGREVAAEAGSYAITGTSATLVLDIPLAAGAGSYSISGVDATFSVARNLIADTGSYAITGTAAAVTVGTVAAESTGGDWVPTKAQAKRFRDYHRQLEKAQTKEREEREATERRILESIERAYEDLTQPERAQVVAEAVMAVAPGAVTVIEELAFPAIDWTVFAGDLEALRGILAHIEQAAWAGLARAQARAVADAAMIAAMNEEMDIEVLLLLAA